MVGKEVAEEVEKLTELFDKDFNAIWPISNIWNIDAVLKYRIYMQSKAQFLQKSGNPFTCDDLALEIIMNFCRDNGLPFQWTTGAEVFTVYSKNKYPTFSDFLLAVKRKSGAPDFANVNNTNIISESLLEIGSLVVLTSNDGRTNPNHVQILSNILKFELQMQYDIYQGNFTDAFLMGRLTGSDDPTSFRYLGSEIQKGMYDKQTDTFVNSTKNTVTTHFYLEHYKGQYREFNFLKWK